MLQRDKDKLFRPRYDKENGCWVATKSSLNHRGEYEGYVNKCCVPCNRTVSGQYDNEGRKCGHWTERTETGRVETDYVEGKPTKRSYYGRSPLFSKVLLDKVEYYENGHIIRREEYEPDVIPGEWVHVGGHSCGTGYTPHYEYRGPYVVATLSKSYDFPRSENDACSEETEVKQEKGKNPRKLSRLANIINSLRVNTR